MFKVQELKRKARTMYNSDLVPDRINRHNQRKWVRSVLRLGDHWLVAKPIGRLNATESST